VNSGLKVFKKYARSTKANKAFIVKANRDARAAYVASWGAIMTEIPQTVYTCATGCTNQASLGNTKSKVFGAIDKQLEVVLRVMRQIRKATKAKTPVAQSKRLEREGRSVYSNMRRLLNDIPDASYKSAC
jgi:hypothetical protein